MARILVVDDSSFSRRIIVKMLKTSGYVVLEACDGIEAIQQAQSKSFDLILMDVRMPNMDGLEATRTLRQSGLTIPIIALTADAREGDVEKVLAAGCNEHLPKPFNQNTLLSVLKKYLSPENVPLAEDADSAKSQHDELIQSDSGQESLQTDSSSSAAGDDTETPIDWSTIMNNLGNEETIMDVTEGFTEEAIETIQNLNEAVKVKNSENVQLYAHSLRGTSAMIGANRLRENARQLECAGEERNTEVFDSLFNDVKEDCDKVMAFLSEENWLETAKKHDCNKQQVG